MADRPTPFYISVLAPRMLKPMSRTNVWLYRMSGGRVAGRIGRRPLCLLTTIGRRSGEPRTSALLYVPDGDNVVLVAAQGGLPAHPMWLLNLRANPEVKVQIGSRTRPMLAREASAEERALRWPRLIEHYQGWARYQSWTDREIPVVICTPMTGEE
jgi:deazaflavin-dependent oxidoreductase (nitroreductase family)